MLSILSQPTDSLVWVIGIFIAGSLLILERRCLGQMAVVQPLVVCAGAGLIISEPVTGIWLGIVLQLFSVGRVRHVDWALCGVVAASSLLYLYGRGVTVTVGGPEALLVTAVVIFVGIASKSLDKFYAKKDGERLRRSSPWQKEDPATAIERSVRTVSLRWILVGGAEVVLGTALVVAAVTVSKYSCDCPWQNGVKLISALVLILSAAAAVASLRQSRYLILAAVSAVGCWAVLA